MMAEKEDDLGLSLSLSLPKKNHHSSLQLNLTPSLVPTCTSSAFVPLKSSCDNNITPAFSFPDPSTNPCRSETRSSLLKGIDVNRLPAAAVDCEEEAGVSSPNSTISSVSGKRSERELGSSINGDELEVDERPYSRGTSDEDEGDNSRKKLRLSKDQSAVLEDSFKEHNTLNPKQKLALAKHLGLRPRQVEVWFQNRRARTKLKQTEVDCEFLKRCCEKLTEENRRLQKEVQELRALKLSSQFYTQMTPPTTLTMCPSCERVAVPPPTSSSSRRSTTTVDPCVLRAPQVGPTHHQPPFNLWAAPGTPVSHGVPFDALRSRS